MRNTTCPSNDRHEKPEEQALNVAFTWPSGLGPWEVVLQRMTSLARTSAGGRAPISNAPPHPYDPSFEFKILGLVCWLPTRLTVASRRTNPRP